MNFMHTPNHSCQQLIADIQLLLDGELDRHKENNVRNEMEQCETCLQYFNSHQVYKKTISQKVTRMSCGHDFKESMLSKIRGL